jgi:hypothetical protein
MSVEENNGPEAPYQGPAHKHPDSGEGHDSGLEKATSEPKQGVDEADAKKNRVDWNPPPGNPGSDQDAQQDRDMGSAETR